jgi:spore maturation protein CgeB
MKLVIFGLSISSSWGNGHATLWRALCRALGRRGHRVVFFERDLPYYAPHRDCTTFEGCDLRLYSDWPAALEAAGRELRHADVGMVTSYCPDGAAACDLVLDSDARVRCFYDLDTPVTFAHLDAGERPGYLPPYGLSGFDVVLSYTGGAALRRLQSDLGARCAVPLYGSVDPDVHHPAGRLPEFGGDLSYLGTYAEDRQEALVRLFLEPARLRPGMRFVIGGAQYPQHFPWTSNIYFVRHLPPALHGAFYCSSRMTLNVTRQAMAECGYCPPGRLFEAAACGVPVLTDIWEGLDSFYESGSEMIFCESTDDVLDALALSDEELERIGRAARERTFSQHTAAHRAVELEAIMQEAGCRMARA